ncbi:LamG-like jellyroll fold domain-containing protein [Polaribacter sargassicola]|uniref:LamG-like jellyroll fold domain-containing protein n=1 Tax=Polaribacter sargassicola TaxID=2836891 RepID=UPI001F224A30|nr:LamG-like jellyroll fold domain-containing protein [Polaribacter sp. DS7-9]MCG1035775.1 T9SS type A sorting domain-containing protein [Polaribacter sp. DS7-9]
MKKITLLKAALFVASIFTVTSYTRAQTLIAHYTFDNTLNDETGNWNLNQSADFAGTLSYVSGKDGTENTAVTGFSGPDYLETATNFSISGNDSRTMAAWINTDATSATVGVVGLGEGASKKKWTFGRSGDKIRIEIQGSGMSAGAFTAGTWNHIAVTYNSSDGKVTLYLNGDLVGENTWTDVNTTATPLRIGNDYNNNTPPQSRGFNGAIDDIQIYSDALTATQISTLYNTPILSNEKFVAKTFATYPNPVSDVLNFTSSDINSVDVYNILGAKVATLKVINKSINFDTFNKGIYIVDCKNTNGVSISKIKIVKK